MKMYDFIEIHFFDKSSLDLRVRSQNSPLFKLMISFYLVQNLYAYLKAIDIRYMIIWKDMRRD